jgi:hypothetical protein
VKSLDDASNFEFIEEEAPGPNIESLRNAQPMLINCSSYPSYRKSIIVVALQNICFAVFATRLFTIIARKEVLYLILSKNCRQRKEFKNLPYIGFTFTSDKGKAQALECKVRNLILFFRMMN